MIEEVKTLIGSDIESILKDGTLSLSLLKCYSKIYLNGSQPRTCSKAMRGYHNKLKKDGMNKAQILQKVSERTCELVNKGLRYIPSIQTHIVDSMLYDEKAIQLLESGALRQSDFTKLPYHYQLKIEAPTEEVKKEVKQSIKRKKSTKK